MSDASVRTIRISKEVSIPTCLSGIIRALPPSSADICMDGASHVLETITEEPVRLKAKDDKVKRELDRHANGVATVCGNWVKGTKCARIDVYSLGVQSSFFGLTQPLWDGDLPWPGI